ncbi:MAG: hypothetical protein Q8P15_01850 [Nanoarchaeota archaeon]|nr:hypothetical protein [Nanoarchaeota archaeon]
MKTQYQIAREKSERDYWKLQEALRTTKGQRFAGPTDYAFYERFSERTKPKTAKVYKDKEISLVYNPSHNYIVGSAA